jgi:tetratricopeptide (TPR) repeat protein
MRSRWRTGLIAGLLLVGTGTAARGMSRPEGPDSFSLRKKGVAVGAALLVEYYNELPDPRGGSTAAWSARLQSALDTFRQRIAKRYTEGTLQRLLEASDPVTRRAAVLALGMIGDMKNSNGAVAAMLHDEDRSVHRLAADALRSLWFRADSPANNQELLRVMQIRDPKKRQAGFNALIEKAPRFAEALNQRAILYYQTGELEKSIADCEAVLKLNPYHFLALSGMAQCYMKLDKPRAALKAFRNAHRVNPGMPDIEEAIRALESALGEEGKKNDDR